VVTQLHIQFNLLVYRVRNTISIILGYTSHADQTFVLVLHLGGQFPARSEQVKHVGDDLVTHKIASFHSAP